MRVTAVYKEYLNIPPSDYKINEKNHTSPNVFAITEHLPQGEGDVHYCDVVLDNGTAIKVCRPDYICYGNDGDK